MGVIRHSLCVVLVSTSAVSCTPRPMPPTSQLDFVSIAQRRLKEHNLEFWYLNGGGASTTSRYSEKSWAMGIKGTQEDANAFLSEFRELCQQALSSTGAELLGWSESKDDERL
jgi:hypothetical protein